MKQIPKIAFAFGAIAVAGLFATASPSHADGNCLRITSAGYSGGPAIHAAPALQDAKTFVKGDGYTLVIIAAAVGDPIASSTFATASGMDKNPADIMKAAFDTGQADAAAGFHLTDISYPAVGGKTIGTGRDIYKVTALDTGQADQYGHRTTAKTDVDGATRALQLAYAAGTVTDQTRDPARALK